MKKLILNVVLLIVFTSAICQPPQAFKYQMVVRNNLGEILQNEVVDIRISIHDITAGGTIVYQETFSETTNQFGLVNLDIGNGTPTIGIFTDIDWSSNSKFIETEIDPAGGTAYVSIGTSELLSVPYSLYSSHSADVVWNQSGNEIYYNDGNVGIGLVDPLRKLHVNGSTLIGSESKGILMRNNGIMVDVESMGTGLAINYHSGNNTVMNVESGRVGIGTNNPDVTLHIGTGTDIELDTGGYLVLGSPAYGNIGIDDNEIMARNNGSASILHLNHEGGNVLISAAGDGKLGIGTSSPGATLDVRGHIWQTGIGMSVFIGKGAGLNDDLSDNENSFIGYNAGNANTTGYRNTANGSYSLYENTTGYYNTASGSYALNSNTTGLYNTACGSSSLRDNTEGNNNTANGTYTLRYNTTGHNNTATGYASLLSNTTGFSNVAIGNKALYHNTTRSNLVAVGDSALYNNGIGVVYQYEANQNTALGSKALFSNTRGVHLTACGFESLYSNTTGEYNTANGSWALSDNTEGSFNTANGFQSLSMNTSGNNNTSHGASALGGNTTGDYNTAVGYFSLAYSSIGSFNTSLGYFASTGLNYGTSNSTGIGYNAQPESSNRIMLGNASVTWIGGHSTWYNTSDARMKNNILEDVKGLDFIMQLRPVTYHFDIDKMNALIGVTDSSDYAEKYDKEKLKQSGFLAQEVERAAQNSGYDFSGVCAPKGDVKFYSMAYAEFVVPLVKGMQEQQAMIEEQQAVIEELTSRIEELERSK